LPPNQVKILINAMCSHYASSSYKMFAYCKSSKYHIRGHSLPPLIARAFAFQPSAEPTALSATPKCYSGLHTLRKVCKTNRSYLAARQLPQGQKACQFWKS